MDIVCSRFRRLRICKKYTVDVPGTVAAWEEVFCHGKICFSASLNVYAIKVDVLILAISVVK